MTGLRQKIEKMKKEIENEIDEAWEMTKHSLENASDTMKICTLGKCVGKKEMLKNVGKRTRDEFTMRMVDREVSYAKYMKTKKKHIKFSLDILYAKLEIIDQILNEMNKTISKVKKKLKDFEKRDKKHNKNCFRLVCIVCMRNSTRFFALKDFLKLLDNEVSK